MRCWANGFRLDSAMLGGSQPIHGVGFTGWQQHVASKPSTNCDGSTGVTGQRTGYPAVHFSLLSLGVACAHLRVLEASTPSDVLLRRHCVRVLANSRCSKVD